MERDQKIMGRAINRAVGRSIKTPLYGTMYTNFKTMSEQALFAPDETYANRQDRYMRLESSQPIRDTRRMQFSCTAGRA